MQGRVNVDKADVDGLYLQRCEGGRHLIGLEDCVQVEAHSLEMYLSTSNKKIVKEASRSRIIENSKYGRNKEEITLKENRESMKENLFMDSLAFLQRK